MHARGREMMDGFPLTLQFLGFRLLSTREATVCFTVWPFASHSHNALGSVPALPARVGSLQVLWGPPTVREQARQVDQD